MADLTQVVPYRQQLQLVKHPVEEVLPAHFAEQYPNLILFLKKYYEHVDAVGTPEGNMHNVFNLHDITSVEPQFLSFLEQQFLLGRTNFSAIDDKRAALRINASLYRAKGSKFSLEQFFRMFFGVDAIVEYPKKNMFIVGESEIGAESLRYITNNELYQTYAILIKTSLGLSSWKESYKLFVHPAGMFLGAQLSIETSNVFDRIAMPDVIPLRQDIAVTGVGSMLSSSYTADVTGIVRLNEDSDYRIGLVNTIRLYQGAGGRDTITLEGIDAQYNNLAELMTASSPGMDNAKVLDGNSVDVAAIGMSNTHETMDQERYSSIVTYRAVDGDPDDDDTPAPEPSGYHRTEFTDPNTRRLTLNGNPTTGFSQGTTPSTLWRLTQDKTVRDYINYHNTQCWSHDGRYVCIERWVDGAGSYDYTTSTAASPLKGKSTIQIYIMDLETDSEIYIDNGMAPRWAKLSNKLAYAHFVQEDGLNNWQTGIENRMYDCEKPENGNIVVGYGMQELGEWSRDDKNLYGVRRFPSQSGIYDENDDLMEGTDEDRVSPTGKDRVPVRIFIDGAIQSGSSLPSTVADTRDEDGKETYWLTLADGLGIRPLPSRKYDVIAMRAKKDLEDSNEVIDKVGFDQNRSFSDLNGENSRTATIGAGGGHQAWSGDGEWWILGNQQLIARTAADGEGTSPNNLDSVRNGHSGKSGYPSNLHILSHGRTSDPAECGHSGRWIWSGGGVLDIRTGGSWQGAAHNSQIIYPEGTGDVSEPYDADGKGSPDGTKICFVSNYDLSRPEIAHTSADLSSSTGNPPILVYSTAGFPPSGYLVHKTEVIGYSSKTATSFDELTRQAFGTRLGGIATGGTITLLDSRIIPSVLRDANNSPNFMDGTYFTAANGDLKYQQQTDAYVCIVRKPDAPYLHEDGSQMELVPGENHRETAGYRIFKLGVDSVYTLISGAALIQPGASFTLSVAGTYTARAVEKSGLEGYESNAFVTTTSRSLNVLGAIPVGFSWFTDEWKVSGSVVTESQAKAAAVSSHLTSHRSEGLLSTETWNLAKLIQRDTQDYFGVVCKKEYYSENTAGVNRIHLREFYRDPDNVALGVTNSLYENLSSSDAKLGIVSEEIFDIETGWKLSMKQWRYDDAGFYKDMKKRKKLSTEWFLTNGVPMEYIYGGDIRYLNVDSTWVEYRRADGYFYDHTITNPRELDGWELYTG
jgi:hypothetical protein